MINFIDRYSRISFMISLQFIGDWIYEQEIEKNQDKCNLVFENTFSSGSQREEQN